MLIFRNRSTLLRPPSFMFVGALDYLMTVAHEENFESDVAQHTGRQNAHGEESLV